ncbi:serine hydrolase domain-containing protein [Aspergillus affinis]|uniref:serine hydrolase domain-containing protein n=1 Tax=Aspergillus affinis TaxID=1070780 RepID=UPI0022FE52C5|nr:beta-lactamase [Aspergillus affinis]KAI9038268.1 beta-lactamase [Aspergillus affinis]
MTSVQGTCDPTFAAVRDLLEKQVNSHDEIGASICVNIEGRTVIDIWGGYADRARTEPWKEDTIVPVWSITKTVMSLAVLILVDRGILDPYAPVAKYWPDFATPDKEKIQVRHFLSHTAGLPSWDPPLESHEFYDVPFALEKLVQQQPWWEPGTASGYHMTSQGYLIGELVRRVTGKTLGEFIHAELAGPRDADFHLPVSEEHWPRIGQMELPPPLPVSFDGDEIQPRAFRGSKLAPEACNTPEFRRLGIGAMTGFANARAVNRILSIVSLHGEVDGKRFVSPETIDLIFQEQMSGKDLVLGYYIRLGMGYGLPPQDAERSLKWIPDGRVCYWGGFGGSIGIMDLDRKMTITYAMNKMGYGTLGNENTVQYVKAVYEAFKDYKPKL